MRIYRKNTTRFCWIEDQDESHYLLSNGNIIEKSDPAWEIRIFNVPDRPAWDFKPDAGRRNNSVPAWDFRPFLPKNVHMNGCPAAPCPKLF